MIPQLLLAMLAGWLQRHQQQVITSLQEENRVLKAQLGGRRLRLTDTERRRLAALAYPLERQRLHEVATFVTPDTLMRWYRQLIARKFDGSIHCKRPGRPPVAEEFAQLVVQMADANPTWGYRHDRDTKVTQAFDGLLKSSGVEPVVLLPRSPNLNAHGERFVRSVKEEALDQMVILGERGLHHVIRQYLMHYFSRWTRHGNVRR